MSNLFDENGFINIVRNSKKGHVTSKIKYEFRPLPMATWEELLALPQGSVVITDIECYGNFFYIGMAFPDIGKFYAFEQSPDFSLDTEKLFFALWYFKIITFNGINYDIPIITYALSGKECHEIKYASDCIIQQNLRPFQFKEMFYCEIPYYNHIDLMEVAPLSGSLKTYAGRLDCERMQDLPFAPDLLLSKQEAELTRNYCGNDLLNTYLLYVNLKDQLDLRVKLGVRYECDLRSKSDAQIAETVLGKTIKNITGSWPKKPNLDIEYIQYEKPDNIVFKTKNLNALLELILDSRFYLDNAGSPVMPLTLKGFDLSLDEHGNVLQTPTYTPRQADKPDKWKSVTVTINGKTYRIGMGGLHSCEKSIGITVGDDEELADNDVESYYPRIIINHGYEPAHLKGLFLEPYTCIVDERVEAKRTGDSDTANTLKIVINGSFGKLGSKYSIIYAPHLMLQVTICGQLFLLMLIEYMELNGIEVVSANTDGIVLRYKKHRRDDVRRYVKEWEEFTNFKTEETLYKGLYIKDVNNYIALKHDGSCKFKGEYSNPWADKKQAIFRFNKNPENRVCIEAIEGYLKDGSSIAKHIRSETDIRKFVCVGNVKGGGHKDGIYLGKVVRWYYKKGETGGINYIGSGNQVQSSTGAWPLMDLPNELPNDIDYDFYIAKATSMLYDIGVLKKKTIKSIV